MQGKPNARQDQPLIDLEQLGQVPAEQIPALLAQLAAAQVLLASRLLENGSRNGSNRNAGEKGKVLKIQEAAARLGKSTDWLYRHHSSLPFTVRVGTGLGFSEAGLEKWVNNRSGR